VLQAVALRHQHLQALRQDGALRGRRGGVLVLEHGNLLLQALQLQLHLLRLLLQPRGMRANVNLVAAQGVREAGGRSARAGGGECRR
jgi:hypothetical protein